MDTQPNAEQKGEAPAEAKPAQEAEQQQETKAGEAEAPKEMRAVILNGFGGLKSVKIVRRPEPALADGEVLIRVQLWWVPPRLHVRPYVCMSAASSDSLCQFRTSSCLSSNHFTCHLNDRWLSFLQWTYLLLIFKLYPICLGFHIVYIHKLQTH